MKLDPSSPIDSRLYPFLHSWDATYRSNPSSYQSCIDKLSFSLQRGQRSYLFLGKWWYPHYFQRDLILLDLYQKKQTVGSVFPAEVELYKEVNPSIANDLSKAFNAKYYIPFVGVGLGVASFGVGHLFNWQYSLRTGVFWALVAADVLVRWSDKSQYVKSAQFLDWLVQYRKAKARIEYDQGKFGGRLAEAREVYKGKEPLEDVYEKIVKMAEKEREV